MGRNNGKKACKRRLSMLTNSMSSLNTSNISNISKQTCDEQAPKDTIDAANSDLKRKFMPESQPSQSMLTPQLQFRTAPVVVGKSIKATLNPLGVATSLPNSQLVVCNSFVYATCRDALNEDLNSNFFPFISSFAVIQAD